MEIHIASDIEELSTLVADWMVDHINKVLQQKDHFTLVLSGGSTPEKLHKLLANDAYKNEIDWSKLHIFWGDERFVPLSDERSNAKMAFDTLLNHVPVKQENIHMMQTENISPEDAAIAYENILHKYFTEEASQTFDLILLGMGDDAHTLSLFPGKTSVIHETQKWCTSLWLEAQNMHRVTLTHGIVNKSACIAFLTAGPKKTKALYEVLRGPYNPDLYPSQIIKPVNGELHWFVDKCAAADLL